MTPAASAADSERQRPPPPAKGVGLGLRRSLMDAMLAMPADAVDFLEFAPENWIGVGGAWGRKFRQLTERFPSVCHGLSLSLGGYAPLDCELLRQVREFMDRHDIAYYSEHLSYGGDDAPLYELLPIPFTEEAAASTAERILQAQDILGRRIAIENASYYMATANPGQELDFLLDVLRRADCLLLLDINNVFCNSHNHSQDPLQFLDGVPPERVAYLHLAGHRMRPDGVIIDSHGAPVPQAVWELLDHAYERLGPVPTLVERDSQIPPLEELLGEVERAREAQRAVAMLGARRAHG